LQNVKGRGQSAEVGEVIIKMGREEIGSEDMDCIYLDQDRGQWLALVNTLMNLGGP
jgi:hypothetical protein